MTVLAPVAGAGTGGAITYRGTTQQGRHIRFEFAEQDGGGLALTSVQIRFHTHCDDGRMHSGVWGWEPGPPIPLEGETLDARGSMRIVGTFGPERATGRIVVVLVYLGPPPAFTCRTTRLNWHARLIPA